MGANSAKTEWPCPKCGEQYQHIIKGRTMATNIYVHLQKRGRERLCTWPKVTYGIFTQKKAIYNDGETEIIIKYDKN